MKNLYSKFTFLIGFLLFANGLLAQDNSSKFVHPLNIQAVGLYSKIQVDGSAWERRNGEKYQNNKTARVEGEIKAFENLSFAINTGYTDFTQTDSGSYKGRDRVGFGAKTAWEGENWQFGMGVFGYSKDTTIPKTESFNPNFLLVRPYLGGGFRFLGFQILANVEFQTETNSKFKETYNEEFRRHYKAGASLAYTFFDKLTLFLEAETRIPYNKEIDTNIRYGNAYPGISYKSDLGTFALSAGIPVIDDRLFDRQAKLSYFYFW
ncbi:MAG: hypothetical protein MH321_11035 [Leptospiraceae bacterium]|nr:hypothetical protein [Leptospiraceae bacterium]